MENEKTVLELLYREGDKLKAEAEEKRAEAKKLNSNKEWFGLMAYDQIERKEAKKVFATSAKIREVEAKLKAIKTTLELTQQEEFPEVCKALDELKALKIAMREYILTGRTTEINGRVIASLGDVLAVYVSIEARLKKVDAPRKAQMTATA